MPLLNHFDEPWLIRRPWAGFYSTWLSQLAKRLNGEVLPPDTVAMPTLEDGNCFELHVCHEHDDEKPRTLAVVALITPIIKDVKENTDRFLRKLMGWLQQKIGVMIVDIVTAHKGNVHHALIERISGNAPEAEASHLYVTAYRTVTADGAPRLDVWEEKAELGQPLPKMPLWISDDKSLVISLERAYQGACKVLRMPV